MGLGVCTGMSYKMKDKLPPEANWDDTRFSLAEYRKRVSMEGKPRMQSPIYIFGRSRYRDSITDVGSVEIHKIHSQHPEWTDKQIAKATGQTPEYVRVVARRRNLPITTG